MATGSFGVALSRLWRGWKQALVIVAPDTVLRWQRRRFRDYWTRLSRRLSWAAPPVTPEIRALVARMAAANPLWGAPRIHGELLKVGMKVAERTVSRLMPKRRPSPSQTWRTFLTNHVRDLVSMDFLEHGESPHESDTLLAKDGPDSPPPAEVALIYARGRSTRPTRFRERDMRRDGCHARPAGVTASTTLGCACPRKRAPWPIPPVDVPLARTFGPRDVDRKGGEMVAVVGDPARNHLTPRCQRANEPGRVFRYRSIRFSVITLSFSVVHTSQAATGGRIVAWPVNA